MTAAASLPLLWAAKQESDFVDRTVPGVLGREGFDPVWYRAAVANARRQLEELKSLGSHELLSDTANLMSDYDAAVARQHDTAFLLDRLQTAALSRGLITPDTAQVASRRFDEASTEATVLAEDLRRQVLRTTESAVNTYDVFSKMLSGMREYLGRFPPSELKTVEEEIVGEIERLRVSIIEFIRYVTVARPTWDLPTSPLVEAALWTFRISPIAYLRAMANLFWSAVRHPLSATVVDLSSGRVLYRV